MPPFISARQQIAQISLSPRFAWQVKLDNGMVLELGREEMQQRLARFVAVYPYSLEAAARPAKPGAQPAVGGRRRAATCSRPRRRRRRR